MEEGRSAFKILTGKPTGIVLYECEAWSLKIGGETQAKGIWEQDPEMNISAQEKYEWGVEKASQWGTS